MIHPSHQSLSQLRKESCGTENNLVFRVHSISSEGLKWRAIKKLCLRGLFGLKISTFLKFFLSWFLKSVNPSLQTKCPLGWRTGLAILRASWHHSKDCAWSVHLMPVVLVAISERTTWNGWVNPFSTKSLKWIWYRSDWTKTACFNWIEIKLRSMPSSFPEGAIFSQAYWDYNPGVAPRSRTWSPGLKSRIDPHVQTEIIFLKKFRSWSAFLEPRATQVSGSSAHAISKLFFFN